VGGGHASPGLELSARQSGLSFQRTRMSADRTLLSMLRTAISLVGFGFTISQFLGHMRQMPEFARIVGHAGRNFGLALVLLGNGLLAGAIAQHLAFRRSLRAERALLVQQGLLHAEEPFASSLSFYAALLFLLLALAVVLGMLFRAGPFG
jgi:putative membrane protein